MFCKKYSWQVFFSLNRTPLKVSNNILIVVGIESRNFLGASKWTSDSCSFLHSLAEAFLSERFKCVLNFVQTNFLHDKENCRHYREGKIEIWLRRHFILWLSYAHDWLLVQFFFLAYKHYIDNLIDVYFEFYLIFALLDFWWNPKWNVCMKADFFVWWQWELKVKYAFHSARAYFKILWHFHCHCAVWKETNEKYFCALLEFWLSWKTVESFWIWKIIMKLILNFELNL